MIESSVCEMCKRAIIPPRIICPYCGIKAGRMKRIDVSPEGEILSYTVLEMPPEGFAAPILLALIEFDQGAIALCRGDTRDIASVRIGLRVRIDVGEDELLSFRLI